MATRYFATRTAHIPLFCQAGKVVRWPSPDGMNGMVAIPDKETEIADCLDVCIKTGTGGDIREVTAREYDDWEKKRRGRLHHHERETIGSSGPASDTLSPKVADSPAVAPVAAEAPKRMQAEFITPPNSITDRSPTPAPAPAKPAPAAPAAPITRRRGPVSAPATK